MKVGGVLVGDLSVRGVELGVNFQWADETGRLTVFAPKEVFGVEVAIRARLDGVASELEDIVAVKPEFIRRDGGVDGGSQMVNEK